jgi:hypothetical protein
VTADGTGVGLLVAVGEVALAGKLSFNASAYKFDGASVTVRIVKSDKCSNDQRVVIDVAGAKYTNDESGTTVTLRNRKG